MDDLGADLNIIIPVLPLSATIAIMALQFNGIDESNLGFGICPMGFVPPGAISSKAKAAMLAIVKAIQSAEYAADDMTIADSVVLSKLDGYIPDDFVELDFQIKAFLPILCAAVGMEHAFVAKYKASRDYLETTKRRVAHDR